MVLGGEEVEREGVQRWPEISPVTHCAQVGSEGGRESHSDGQRPAVKAPHAANGGLPILQTRGWNLSNLPHLHFL